MLNAYMIVSADFITAAHDAVHTTADWLSAFCFDHIAVLQYAIHAQFITSKN